MHGVMLIPDSITRDGNPITGTNANVCVGQQMNLTNAISGITNTAITYHWGIPGVSSGTAFKDYEPETNAPYACNYTNLAPSDLTNSYCNFYWLDGMSNQVVYCTNVIYGKTYTVSATLNVLSPTTNSIIATTNAADPIAADTNYYLYPDAPNYLHFGQNRGTNYGIAFSQTNSSPSGYNGNFIWAQIITTAIFNTTNSSGVPFGQHSVGGIDTTYPYISTNSAGDANDSPALPLLGTDAYGSFNFAATMYLTWQASTNSTSGDKTVPIALRGVNWNWSGAATNSSGWTLVPGSAIYPTNLNDFPATNQVQWSSNATNLINN